SSFFYLPCTPAFFTLSLHDALPIYLACDLCCHRPEVILVEALYVGNGPTHLALDASSLIAHLLWFFHRILHFFLLELLWVFLVLDRKSTRLNSSHVKISYAVFCLKK